jgi:uncharacterized membrane-anchored protein
MKRVRRLLICAMVLGVLAVPIVASPQAPASPGTAEETPVMREIRALPWQHGPAAGSLGAMAILQVPKGQMFLDGPNTRRFLELNRNPPRDNRYTLAAEDFGWFAIFFFEDSGYVKDDEKLDPDALLKSLQEGDTLGNQERKRLNMPAIHTAGWAVPPHYDQATKRLEWGLKLRGEDGHLLVNYTIRLLGRRGVMHAILVSDPDSLENDIAVFKKTLTAFDFNGGERYAEFKAGDRVAEYGLAALVLGGAAAVATKTGFFKAIGKFAIYGVVAAGAALAALWRKFFGRA